MPYVLKIDALLDLEPGREVEITERYFYGGDTIDVGDEAFLWFSGSNQRLAWSVEVTRVGQCIDGRLTVTVRCISSSTQNVITTSQLKPFRDIDDGSVASKLSHKFYRHSHNKVARISEEEALFLRKYFLSK